MRLTWRWESGDENRLEPWRPGSPPLPLLDMLKGNGGLRDARKQTQGLAPTLWGGPQAPPVSRPARRHQGRRRTQAGTQPPRGTEARRRASTHIGKGSTHCVLSGSRAGPETGECWARETVEEGSQEKGGMSLPKAVYRPRSRQPCRPRLLSQVKGPQAEESGQ